MKKKILSTILLITIVLLGVLLCFRLIKRIDNQEKTTEKVENMQDDDTKNNENVILEEKNETEVEEIVENDGVNKSKSTPSASKSKTSTIQNASTNKKTSSNTTKKQQSKKDTNVESTKEPVKVEEKKEIVKQEPTSTPKQETPKPAEEKKEEEKTKEVVIEVPDSKSYKNDSAFIKLQKELFRTFKECNDAGEKEWRKDPDNVSNIYCEAEYYKGAEAGIRLYIVYNDKTWKKYSR